MVDAPRTAVLVTGAGGYVGRLLVATLADAPAILDTIVAVDIQPPQARHPGVIYETIDICDASIVDVMRRHTIDTVVHLAAVVTPRPDQDREAQRVIDVDGTDNVLAACVEADVRKFVYTSSGAAYGYHADNPVLIDEDDPIRGNEIFAYAWHKRLVEERLAEYRSSHPQLEQLVFRVSTILGPSVHNQITAMFERPVVVGVAGADTPFCFISDEDVVACLERGVRGDETGVYNLTGDGVMTLREIAAAMGRRYLAVPEPWLRCGLTLLSRFDSSPYGPEQVIFLRHRPVLGNRRLKETFGFAPRWSSRQTFETYRHSRA